VGRSGPFPSVRRAVAQRAYGLLRETDPDHVLLDGTLAKRDRVGDGRADYSHKTPLHLVMTPVSSGGEAGSHDDAEVCC
jgi:hypothetical protein